MTRLASIDIGSNSIHLIVVDIAADASFQTVELVRSSLPLGEGWTSSEQKISPERLEEALSVLSAFVGKALLLDADQILCSATAALRDAENREDFVARIEAELDIPLRVLTGVEEAAIVYRGTRQHVEEDVLLFDLGGRSTEIVCGDGTHPEACLSLSIGHLGLYSDHPHPQPAAPSDWKTLLSAAQLHIQDVPEMAGNRSALCSPSGAVRTLARMAAFRRGDQPKGRGDGISFTQEELADLVETMVAADSSDLNKIPGIDPRRAETLLAAAAIVQALMLHFSQDQVLAVRGGLRDGLIMEWAEAHREG